MKRQAENQSDVIEIDNYSIGSSMADGRVRLKATSILTEFVENIENLGGAWAKTKPRTTSASRMTERFLHTTFWSAPPIGLSSSRLYHSGPLSGSRPASQVLGSGAECDPFFTNKDAGHA